MYLGNYLGITLELTIINSQVLVFINISVISNGQNTI